MSVHAEGAKLGFELFGELKDDASHAQALGGFDVGGDVVDVDGFLGTNFHGAKGFAVDERVGFAGTDGAGIDSNGKEAEEIVVSFDVGDVDGVGIGKKREAVMAGKSLEKGIFEDGDGIESAIPGVDKLFERERAAEAFDEMKMPIARPDAALLPVLPARIVGDGGPDFVGKERNIFCEAG